MGIKYQLIIEPILNGPTNSSYLRRYEKERGDRDVGWESSYERGREEGRGKENRLRLTR